MSVCVYPLEVYFNTRGVKKYASDIIKVEVTYIPIKGGIVYSDVNRFFYSSSQALVVPHMMLKCLKWKCVQFAGCVHGWERGPSGDHCISPQGPGCFLLCIPHHMQFPHNGNCR